MYIVEVTPFSKTIRNTAYSYFSLEKIDVGSIVTIPLKNKRVKGMVISIRDGKNLKTAIRRSDFIFKKIISASKETFLQPEFIEATKSTAEYFATSVGSIIDAIVPRVVFTEIDKFKSKKNESSTKKDLLKISNDEKEDEDQNLANKKTRSQKYIIQAGDDDRYSEYRSIIREQFARNKSVIFIVPTIEDCNMAKRKVSRGIEKNTFVLNGKISKKKILEIWKNIQQNLQKNKKQVLLIATPKFISLPISNIGIIIVERENSSAYRTQSLPYFDLRFFCEQYSEKLNIPFLYGDIMLRSETLRRYDENVFFEYSPIKFRTITDSIQKFIDLKDRNECPSQENIISKSLFDLIKENLKDNSHLFILNNRKGLAPLIVCEDCGEIFKCDECGSPIVLYGKDASDKSNYFYCPFCGSQSSAGQKCQSCQSWNLKAVGFGTDKVKREIQTEFPNAKIFIIDKDHAKTTAQAQKISKNFYDSPSAILIGTELALLYLNEPIENIAISSIDSMFSSPDFRIRERILNILLKSRSKAQKNFLVQSRNLENNIFKNLHDGNLIDFYRNEFIDRKKYNFPPFSLIIKISIISKDIKKAEAELKNLKKKMQLDDLAIFESLAKRNHGARTIVGILRVDRKDWPNQDLINKFKSLPPKIRLEIDAESLF